MSTRYVLHDSIGSGGMATVHIGQLHAPLGFSRVVAIKRLHPALSHQAEFAAMLVDEARITARVRHLNVVPTLDVFLDDGECFLVMEYVEGESLAKLLRSASQAQTLVPLGVVSAVLGGVLHGLHAAHIAKAGSGEPLNIIHRDVSPQNILVGTDGIARVFDFGVAKALGRLQQTRAGEFKGKLPYLAPEQFGEGAPDRRVDVYAAAVTLWEALTARRLFDGASEEEVFGKILQSRIPAPSELRPGLPAALDELILRGLSRAPSARFASAAEMALALEQAVPPATAREVSAWLQSLAGDALAKRAALVTDMDGGAPAAVFTPAPVTPPRAAAAPAPDPTVTQRMTVRLHAKPRRSFIPAAASAATPSELLPTSLGELAEAPTVVGPTMATLGSSTPPPFSLPAAEPSRPRRVALRASLGALLLLCSLAAPAFGWMAFTDREETPRAAAAPAAVLPVVAAPKIDHVAPPNPVASSPPRLAAEPASPAPSAAQAASAAAAREAPPVITKSVPGRTAVKARPASSARDYLSSPPFAERR